jgi:hypothetical protein
LLAVLFLSDIKRIADSLESLAIVKLAEDRKVLFDQPRKG